IAHAEEALAAAREAQQAIQLRLRESDRDREAHRARLRSREKELMSGRIRSPSELMQLSTEVQHLKASFADLEEAELRLMEEGERNQCLAWHVTVTSSGMQILRKGDGIVQCENCGRILVMA